MDIQPFVVWILLVFILVELSWGTVIPTAVVISWTTQQWCPIHPVLLDVSLAPKTTLPRDGNYGSGSAFVLVRFVMETPLLS